MPSFSAGAFDFRHASPGRERSLFGEAFLSHGTHPDRTKSPLNCGFLDLDRLVDLGTRIGFVRSAIDNVYPGHWFYSTQEERSMVLHALSPEDVNRLLPYSDLQRRLAQAAVDAEGFEYAISHDLRTPLRAVSASASILVEDLGPSLDAKHRNLLDRLAKNASRFGCLIDGLLEFSRLNRSVIARREIDVAKLVHRLAPASRIVSAGVIHGDPALVERALGCLLDNARKFSGDGPIYVRGWANSVMVVDEGIGFEPAHAARIFLPFERLVGDEYAGTGMGLALAERIARLHGGCIHAVASPHLGAAFTIDFGENPVRGDQDHVYLLGSKAS